jgi:hypothetical protein
MGFSSQRPSLPLRRRRPFRPRQSSSVVGGGEESGLSNRCAPIVPPEGAKVPGNNGLDLRSASRLWLRSARCPRDDYDGCNPELNSSLWRFIYYVNKLSSATGGGNNHRVALNLNPRSSAGYGASTALYYHVLSSSSSSSSSLSSSSYPSSSCSSPVPGSTSSPRLYWASISFISSLVWIWLAGFSSRYISRRFCVLKSSVTFVTSVRQLGQVPLLSSQLATKYKVNVPNDPLFYTGATPLVLRLR